MMTRGTVLGSPRSAATAKGKAELWLLLFESIPLTNRIVEEGQRSNRSTTDHRHRTPLADVCAASSRVEEAWSFPTDANAKANWIFSLVL